MRRMAGEFQHHVDDMMREADLGEVRETFRDLRGLNIKSAINTMVDPDGSVGRAFGDPFAEHGVPPAAAASPPVTPAPAAGPAPAFIPPAFVPPAAVPPMQAPQTAPAFIPPHAGADHTMDQH
jgi:sec-independent protein translocase protein TatB